jgi:hypothetical protein
MRRLVGAFAVLVLVGCSDRSIIRNASAAYQYQKAVYQRECCPNPPCPPYPEPRTPECASRDAELTEDYFQIDASINAVERSQGGKLPKAAREKLKQARKDLDK